MSVSFGTVGLTAKATENLDYVWLYQGSVTQFYAAVVVVKAQSPQLPCNYISACTSK